MPRHPVAKLAVHLTLLLFVLCLAACGGAPPLPPPASRDSGAGTTAFVNVTVVPMDADRVLPGQTVLVRGDRILAVGPTAGVAVPEGARTVDGRGKFLMPGLMDMHVHLTREVDLYLYLARGITTVRNMWGAPMHLSWRDRIARGEMLGPTVYTAGPIVDGERPVHDGSFVARSPGDADAVVALHRQAGYDFIKVYSRLSPPVYERLMTAARAAGLTVAGHVPREVGFRGALDAGQVSIEHLNTFFGALQADGSPVAGKTDGPSRERWIDFVDETKIPALVQHIRERGAWICPTRVVMSQYGTAEEIAARLRRPEMRYVPPWEVAVWEPDPNPSAEARARDKRSIEVSDALIRGLHAGGAHLLVGTDTGNPYVVPGFSYHEELERFVQAGLTPFEALRAATLDAADFMHASGEVGTVAAGKRADLLLLDGNPLADVKQADRIAGVMVRGRWLAPADLAGLLAQVEAAARGQDDPFATQPALGVEGTTELAAAYRVTWKDVPFDTERVVVGRMPNGQRVVRAQTFDPHAGMGFTMSAWSGPSGDGERLVLEGDGASGRGRIEVTRDGTQAHARGTLLSGPGVAKDAVLPAGTVLAAGGFFASRILLLPRIEGLAVGQSIEVPVCEVSLGSSVEMPVASWKITRTPDAAGRRYEVATGKGRPGVLTLDAHGWPVELETPAHGATLRFRRKGP